MVRGIVVGAVVLAGCELNPAFDPFATAGDGSGSATAADTADTAMPEPGEPLPFPCDALPPPEGDVITVTPEQAGEIQGMLNGIPEGTTVVFEPGTYALPDGLYVESPEVTLRSSTGNPEDVILDGQRSAGSLVFVVGANVTLAEMTLQRSSGHLVHMSGNGPTHAPGIMGYRLRLLDPGFGAFKGNATTMGGRADGGTLACSTVMMTDPGRDELEEAGLCGSAGGVAMFGVSGWHIRDNHFEGFWCETGDGGSAVHFSESSADNVIERNVVRDSLIGIHLGLYDTGVPDPAYAGYEGCDDGYYDHYGGVIRNNMVIATGVGIAASEFGFDTGIALWQVCETTVVHNTVVTAIEGLSSIEYRFERTKAKVLNNLVSHIILDRNDAGVPVAGNLQEVDLNNFADPLNGDLHLVPGSEAVDAGVLLGDDAALHDIDGEPRNGAPDIGADEI